MALMVGGGRRMGVMLFASFWRIAYKSRYEIHALTREYRIFRENFEQFCYLFRLNKGFFRKKSIVLRILLILPRPATPGGVGGDGGGALGTNLSFYKEVKHVQKHKRL